MKVKPLVNTMKWDDELGDFIPSKITPVWPLISMLSPIILKLMNPLVRNPGEKYNESKQKKALKASKEIHLTIMLHLERHH